MKLIYGLQKLHLTSPFATNKGVKEDFDQIFVSIDDGEHLGTGAAVLAKEPGVAVEEVIATLDQAATVLEDLDLQEALSLVERMGNAPNSPSALSSLDTALLDVASQIAGHTMGEFLGCPKRNFMLTALSIGEMPPDDLLNQVQKSLSWPILKMKVAKSTDPAVFADVRKVYAGRIWVDGNCSWTPNRAVEIAIELKRHGVELLEQPIEPGSPSLMQQIRRHSGLKVIADEDCTSIDQLTELSQCVDGVNIKLFRCGGPRRALEMMEHAKALGLEVMLGCKSESCVGVTAAAHLAGFADHLDLDGHLDIVDDPFWGLEVDHGKITMPAKNGLGLSRRRN